MRLCKSAWQNGGVDMNSLVTKLQAYKPDWDLIARTSGIPLGTVVKVGMGYTKNPRVRTAEALWRGVEEYERSRPQ